MKFGHKELGFPSTASTHPDPPRSLSRAAALSLPQQRDGRTDDPVTIPLKIQHVLYISLHNATLQIASSSMKFHETRVTYVLGCHTGNAHTGNAHTTIAAKRSFGWDRRIVPRNLVWMTVWGAENLLGAEAKDLRARRGEGRGCNRHRMECSCLRVSKRPALKGSPYIKISRR